ncbi:MAG TPA: hypothetical protein EYP79_02805 [Campylobacterales bacterium]|nr:hypothetical protein [Campylobacterales bacterium]
MEQKNIDKFEKELIQKLEVLKNCQKSKMVNSCLKCKEIIGCKTRNEYINAVYLSMNKNQSGGFEF